MLLNPLWSFWLDFASVNSNLTGFNGVTLKEFPFSKEFGRTPANPKRLREALRGELIVALSSPTSHNTLAAKTYPYWLFAAVSPITRRLRASVPWSPAAPNCGAEPSGPAFSQP
jgi:hypothetical protein